MKAIIFDLDGTLLNTIEDLADSMNSVLARYALPLHTIREYKLFVGDGAANLVKRSIIGAVTVGYSLERLEAEFRAEYAKRKTDKTAPYDGIPELLSAIAERGVKMAVLSNKPHAATLEVISNYFPGVVFDAVIGQRKGRPIKPDPAGVMEILDIIGALREETLYVGDSGTDMLTATAAGLNSVGVLWGFRDKEELERNGARVFAEHPMDVLRYI